MRLFCLIFLLIISVSLFSEEVDSRQEMRDFVIELRSYADSQTEDFIIIPQNGQELITTSGDPDGIVLKEYLAAIDGTGREDLFFGYDNDDVKTPSVEHRYLSDLCRLFEDNGVEVLVIDYCSTRVHVDRSYSSNKASGYISFAADRRELDDIPAYPPEPYGVNSSNVKSLSDARNFLYLINGEGYAGKADFIAAVTASDYDLLIMDLFHNGEVWTPAEIVKLRQKAGGGQRLLICYMSIGEAEDYRYYWNPSWFRSRPGWLAEENPYWDGNYKVKYWYEQWKKIIYGNNGSYLTKIIQAGFDGVYLDIIDAFEYFE